MDENNRNFGLFFSRIHAFWLHGFWRKAALYTIYSMFFDKTILYIVKTVTFSGNAKEGKVHKCKEVFFRNLVFSKINHNIIIMKRGGNYE
ncbi:hypothetical protein DV714_20550 [Parageobacillus thermoglucosidasius]|nr:hypothetical protein DV714_20550 [Parageobacillus thermoglucosidasius]